MLLKTLKKDTLYSLTVGVDTTFTSDSIQLLNVERYAIAFKYENGSTFGATIKLQCSLDDENYTDVEDSSQLIADDDGLHMWDVTSFSYNYVKVVCTISAGSADIQIDYNLKARID